MNLQKLIRCDPDGVPVDVVEVRACESKNHHAPRLATATAHMVQGPTDYCAECAGRAARVYQVLGTHLHVEALEQDLALAPGRVMKF